MASKHQRPDFQLCGSFGTAGKDTGPDSHHTPPLLILKQKAPESLQCVIGRPLGIKPDSAANYVSDSIDATTVSVLNQCLSLLLGK